MAKKIQNKDKKKALKCPICGKEFYRYLYRIKRASANYCSYTCLHQAMRESEKRKCPVCGKEFGNYKGWRTHEKCCSIKCKQKQKKKKQGVRFWKKKLDIIFSRYIRLRDTNDDGMGYCCSCNKPINYNNADAGHYVHRTHNATRYDERNVNIQCRRCNRYEEGNSAGYTIFLINKYGKEIIDELLKLSRKIKQFTTDELECLYEEYTKKIDDKLNIKNRGWFEINAEISKEERAAKHASSIFGRKKSISMSTGKE